MLRVAVVVTLTSQSRVMLLVWNTVQVYKFIWSDSSRPWPHTFFFQSLAPAGLRRMGMEEHATQVLDWDQMLPAIAQGAISFQCTSDDQARAPERGASAVDGQLMSAPFSDLAKGASGHFVSVATRLSLAYRFSHPLARWRVFAPAARAPQVGRPTLLPVARTPQCSCARKLGKLARAQALDLVGCHAARCFSSRVVCSQPAEAGRDAELGCCHGRVLVALWCCLVLRCRDAWWRQIAHRAHRPGWHCEPLAVGRSHPGTCERLR